MQIARVQLGGKEKEQKIITAVTCQLGISKAFNYGSSYLFTGNMEGYLLSFVSL
jgi:hypothetical protein